MRYIINKLEVEIDNAGLKFGGGKEWFEGLLTSGNESKIRTMIRSTTNTVDLPNMGFLPMNTRPRSASFSIGRSARPRSSSLSIGRSVSSRPRSGSLSIGRSVSSRPRSGSLSPSKSVTTYTNPNPTQIKNWADQKLTVKGTNNVANRVKLLDFNNSNVLHYWAKIKENATPEGQAFKITVDWNAAHQGLGCEYKYALNEKELIVKVKDNYINSDMCAILGGMLFEAHNARNGQHFRTADTNWKANRGTVNHINPIEKALKMVAIETDTYLKSAEDYINIAKKTDGYIGPQEWRNIIGVNTSLGYISYPWAVNGDAISNFAKSIHNPSLPGLAGSSFSAYVPKTGDLQPSWISYELSAWYNKNKSPLQHLGKKYYHFKNHIDYPPSPRGNKALQYFKTLYCVLSKAGQNASVLAWFRKWRVPEDIYDMAVGTVRQTDLSDMSLGTTPQAMKNTVTITPQELYTTYHT